MAEEVKTAGRSKSGQFAKKQGEEALARAKTLTKDSVLESVAKIRSGLDVQVAKIGDIVQEKLTELETVTEAVEFQKAEAERIHGVEAVARSIEEANLALESTKAENLRKLGEFQKDLASKQEEARIENNQKVQLFETQRQQAENAWTYTFNQKKKTDQDQLAEELRIARQAEKVRQENLERGWNLREETLKAQETELTELRTKALNFPAELDKAVSAAEGKARGMAEREKNHEIAILNTQHQAQRTIDQNSIANLNAKLADKDKVIEQLTLQLNAANEAQKAIATKALESAATRQQLADTQMLNQSTNGSNTGPKRA